MSLVLQVFSYNLELMLVLEEKTEDQQNYYNSSCGGHNICMKRLCKL